MGFGIGNLKQIVQDFSESLNQIFGGNTGKGSGKPLFIDPTLGGISSLDKTKWTGNATTNLGTTKTTVKYGFVMMSSRDVKSNTGLETGSFRPFYLDIPPQAISQKEIFATNIQATRKGIIVESEGVVFKDIIISGTTGIFPGPRGGFNSPQANFGDITAAPRPPEGVDSKTGLSRDSRTKISSGYETFLSLRQYFLKYASEKVKTDGDLFLIFINEKDNQALIVEPLEFTMERSSKSPMTYNYKIVLKAIGTLAVIFKTARDKDPTDLLTKIGNVAGNLSAGVGQVRAAVNLTSGLFQKTFQAIDQTINGPLRQIQFALEDLSNGISNTLSLPGILSRNFTTTIANIRESGSAVANQLGIASAATTLTETPSEQAFRLGVESRIANDSRVAMPRSFVETARDTLREQSDNLADAFNMGDPFYNEIRGRVVTSDPGPLKVVSDEEFLLLGNVQTIADNLNEVLATNNAFQSDSEEAFEQAKQAFENPNLPEEQQFLNINKPDKVRQVRIQRNDTLERIALRELGDTLRWPELVVINQLKPPYLDDNGGDGVKKSGEYILVPSS